MSFDDQIHPPGKGDLSYGAYLRVPELLDLQHEISEPRHHDELLFIITHQTYELWFKQLLHEMDTIGAMMASGQTLAATRLAGRCIAILGVLVSQVSVLETMTPMDFLAFRDKLRPASGFQSRQFRELEFLLGIRNQMYLSNYAHDVESRQILERRLAEPPVRELFFALLRDRDFDTPALDDNMTADEAQAIVERRIEALADLYGRFESHYDLFLLAEALLEVDELLQIWRHRHVMMVERVIGGRTGTGGSTGASYLKTTLERRAFPELWDVRTSLGGGHNY
jgi:tryptophan 2,3-dioxygenase